jgi:disulfide bond formation protein DsbB
MTITTRQANALGFAICALLFGYALYQQHVVGLEPCHLCVFQRIGVLAIGLVFLVAALHGPKRGGAKVYGVLTALAAAVTAGIAVRHVWIQQQPPGSVPACGADLDFMLDVMPLQEVVAKVLAGGGECQKIDWQLLGLSMPAWVLMAAVALGAWGLWANWRSEGRAGRIKGA